MTQKKKEFKSFAKTPKEKCLSAREQMFCSFYTSVGEKSYSRGGESARLSGYGSPASASWRLLKKPKIQKRIRELIDSHMKRNNITADRVLSDLQHEKSAALEKGDIASAIAATRLMGLHLKMFSERMEFSLEDSRQLEEGHREAARRIASRLLEDGIFNQPVEPGQLPAPVDRSATMAEQLSGSVEVEQPSVIHSTPGKPKEAEPSEPTEESTEQPAPVSKKPKKPKRFGPHSHAETLAELDAAPSANSDTAAVREQVRSDSRSGGQTSCISE